MSYDDTLKRLIEITEEFSRGRPTNAPLTAKSAVSQDAYIFGIDVYDYAKELEAEYGGVVDEIPWLQWTDQSDSYYGCAVGCFPFIFLGRLLAWPITRAPLLKRPDPKNFPRRLELGHLAKVLEQNYWIEP
jgi:hypothetical protein